MCKHVNAEGLHAFKSEHAVGVKALGVVALCGLCGNRAGVVYQIRLFQVVWWIRPTAVMDGY